MRMEPHQLIQDVSTQWNSTYYMIYHLVDHRLPITAVLSDHTVTKVSDRYLDLKSEQWEMLTALEDVLYTSFTSSQYIF